MQEELIIRILDRASSFIPFENLKRLRMILDEELYHYSLVPTSNELVPVNDMADRIKLYLACKRLDGLSPKTLKNYSRLLLKFAFSIQKNIDQITDMDIRIFMANRAKSGNKNTTLNTLRSAFMSFFGWMEDQGYIAKNPVRKIKAIKTEKRLRQALNREELEMLRDACRTLREKAMVEFFYSTGCRLDEVQKLSLSRINWSDGSMTVIGKGNKEREVYLNEKALFYLKKYLNSRHDTDDAVFVRERRPCTRLCARMIEQIFSNLGKRAGIKKPVYPHLIRHTTATNMLNSGASLPEVQGLLGHEDPSTTQIYAHLCRDAIKESHKKNLAS